MLCKNLITVNYFKIILFRKKEGGRDIKIIVGGFYIKCPLVFGQFRPCPSPTETVAVSSSGS